MFFFLIVSEDQYYTFQKTAELSLLVEMGLVLPLTPPCPSLLGRVSPELPQCLGQPGRMHPNTLENHPGQHTTTPPDHQHPPWPHWLLSNR